MQNGMRSIQPGAKTDQQIMQGYKNTTKELFFGQTGFVGHRFCSLPEAGRAARGNAQCGSSLYFPDSTVCNEIYISTAVLAFSFLLIYLIVEFDRFIFISTYIILIGVRFTLVNSPLTNENRLCCLYFQKYNSIAPELNNVKSQALFTFLPNISKQ